MFKNWTLLSVSMFAKGTFLTQCINTYLSLPWHQIVIQNIPGVIIGEQGNNLTFKNIKIKSSNPQEKSIRCIHISQSKYHLITTAN